MADKEKVTQEREADIILKTYIGVKIIKAIEMDERAFLERKEGQKLDQDTRAGYLVRYEDGYESWSPKNVFEKAYRLLDNKTRSFVISEGAL